MKIMHIDDIIHCVSDNVLQTKMENFGIVLSLWNENVQKLVESIAEHKGNDLYHQADTALKGVLRNIFRTGEFFAEILISKKIQPKTKLNIFILRLMPFSLLKIKCLKRLKQKCLLLL
ncbi:MAG: hypothetical protein K9W44_11070 [Candidatus Lokiarchaeota archaeon]|nr:hypothetical protein [Candidatus Harpocratesius repetitus]